MDRELLKGHTKLIILSALARQPMHGYALSEHIKGEMEDAFKFGVGMLYPLLHAMEKEKLIRGTWRDMSGARKRVYTLTKSGKHELSKQRKEWRRFTKLVGNLVSGNA